MCYHPFKPAYLPMVALFGRKDLSLSENAHLLRYLIPRPVKFSLRETAKPI